MAKRNMREVIRLENYEVTDAQSDLLEEILDTKSNEQGGGKVKRVEQIPLKSMLPDPHQPRPQLPPLIARPFYAGQIDCFTAALQWMELSKKNAFYAIRLDDLLDLGNSIITHGQIKPVTGCWKEVNGELRFVLETGERRFWGRVLTAVLYKENQDQVTLAAVNEIKINRERQAIENEKFSELSAVSRAREIAGLFLYYLGDGGDVGSYDGAFGYHRRIFRYKLGDEYVDRIRSITGLSKTHIYRLVRFLQLPDDVLEMADVYHVPIKVLQTVFDESDHQKRLDIIDEWVRQNNPNLTAETPVIESASRTPRTPEKKSVDLLPTKIVAVKMRRMFLASYKKLARVVNDPDTALADSLFDELRSEEEINVMINRLERLASRLKQKLVE